MWAQLGYYNPLLYKHWPGFIALLDTSYNGGFNDQVQKAQHDAA